MTFRWITVLMAAALLALVAAGCGGDSGGDGSTPDEALSADATVTTSDGYEYEIVEVTDDATEAVLIENQFNDPPGAGQQFLIVQLQATAGPEADGPFSASTRLRLLGPNGRTYTTFQNRCGVIPGRFESGFGNPGATTIGNLCWAVPTEDVDELLLFEDARAGNTNYQRLS